MGRILAVFAFAAALGAGGMARAQVQPAPAPMQGGGSGGYQQHDGFFLQMDLGPGAMKSSASGSGTDVEMSGTAFQFSLVIGGVVAPNFVIGGHLWGAAVNEPDMKVNGQTFSTTDATLGLSAIGLNLTYYFMPANIYISATPSIATLSVERNGTSGETKTGFALRLAVGKEWWVSHNWGLGLNAQFAHSSNDDKGVGAPTWSTNWFGVAFSAAYN